MADKQLSKTNAPVTTRQDLVEEITIGGDTSHTAAAAVAAKEVEARIIAAHKWPRDVDLFREGVLKDCRRPGFAAIALYRKPVGRKKNESGKWEESFAVGFSVRFIESALQHFGNCHVISRVDWETSSQLKLVVGVLDVQKNIGYSTDVVLDKLVERKEVKQGRTVRGIRENSYGDRVYLIDATRDELRNIIGAERSKLMRDNGQRLLPRDILDEARALVEVTLATENARDPDAAKKKILDGFASLGVSAVMLKEYLGKGVEQVTAKDLVDLTSLHAGLKENEFSWADVMRAQKAEAEGEGGTAAKSLADKIKEAAPEYMEPPSGK
jgi:hypothetical protein